MDPLVEAIYWFRHAVNRLDYLEKLLYERDRKLYRRLTSLLARGDREAANKTLSELADNRNHLEAVIALRHFLGPVEITLVQLLKGMERDLGLEYLVVKEAYGMTRDLDIEVHYALEELLEYLKQLHPRPTLEDKKKTEDMLLNASAQAKREILSRIKPTPSIPP